MSEALEEALLQVKKYREQAEIAEATIERMQRQAIKNVADRDLALEKAAQALSEKENIEKRLKKAHGKNRDYRKQIAALQHEMKHPEAQPIEIISFVDDCGHSCVINATGTAQKLKVYRGLIKDALEQGAVSNNEHYNYTELLETGTVEELIESINDSYISTGGCSREGFDAVGVFNEWPDHIELCS